MRTGVCHTRAVHNRGACSVCARCTGVHQPGVQPGVHRPTDRVRKTRCNRALSRFRWPPELSRHDLDSPTKRAHSCNWSVRLKHDGSNGRTRARRGFHVRAGGVSHQGCAHRGARRWCAVCALCTDHRPTSQPAVPKPGATGRRRGSGDLPSCPDTIRIALLNAHTVAVGRSG